MKKIVKILLIIICILLVAVVGLAIYAYEQNGTANVMKGEHNILLLTADPSEKRPGMGAVDMAYAIHVTDGNVDNLTPIYPGFLKHPTEIEPAAANAGKVNMYLHDTLWYEDTQKGAKLAQETVEYNTGIKTDAVVIVTPDAVQALLNSISPIDVPGYTGNGPNAAVQFIRDMTERKDSTMSRGTAVELLMKPIINASKDPKKAPGLFQALLEQYSKGNIVVIPHSLMGQFAISKGLKLL
ncbi:MAG: DUF4012 domain-containing protein [Methanobacterium sp.]|nr:DUF4012 domain-containing protein [Methanobacterium sp.]